MLRQTTAVLKYRATFKFYLLAFAVTPKVASATRERIKVKVQ